MHVNKIFIDLAVFFSRTVEIDHMLSENKSSKVHFNFLIDAIGFQHSLWKICDTEKMFPSCCEIQSGLK